MSTRIAEPTVWENYQRIVRGRWITLMILLAATVFSLCLDVVTGPSNLPFREAVQSVFAPSTAEESTSIIVWQIRLPYAVMALLVGAALSLAGAEMQTTLNNALASPFTLGMSSAAIFGAALAIVFNLSIPGVPPDLVISTNAFLCALLSVLLLQTVARSKGAGPETLVLFGIALFFTFNALVAITQFVAEETALQQLVFWTMGSLSRATWDNIRFLGIAMICVIPFSLAASWKLTAVRLGEERASSLGVDVKRLRFFSLLRISILTATAVAFVGTIAFVGLVGPHIARLLVGEDHRFYLPASALTGALILSLASAASKSIIPGVIIPIGLVTALIGVPFFISLIFSRRGRG
jgi:iron complex transport system permease protein